MNETHEYCPSRLLQIRTYGFYVYGVSLVDVVAREQAVRALRKRVCRTRAHVRFVDPSQRCVHLECTLPSDYYDNISN